MWQSKLKVGAYVVGTLADTYAFIKHCMPLTQHPDYMLGILIITSVYIAFFFALKHYKVDSGEPWYRVRVSNPLWSYGILLVTSLVALQHLK